MSDPIGRFLRGTPSRPEDDDPIGRWLRGADVEDKLGAARTVVDPKSGERAARILRVERVTGLPSDLVDRHLDDIEREARRADFDPQRFARESPRVAAWLAENPQHLAAAAEDLQRLGYLERQIRHVRDRFNAGRATVELSRIGKAAFVGTITPEQRRRQAELEQDVGEGADEALGVGGISNYFAGVPGAIANQLPIFAQTIAGKVKGAAVGAAGGATAGAVAGLAGGPAAPATVPAAAAGGATLGAIFGFRWGGAVAAAELEGSLAYLDYEKIRREDGQPLSREEMVGASSIVGVVNGTLEMLGLESILNAAPGLRALGRAGVRRALMQQTTREAFARYARVVGQAVITEGATEALQSMVTHAGGELTAMIADGSIATLSAGAILDRLFVENLPQAIAEFKVGTQAGGGMAAGLGAPALAVDIRRAGRARADQDFIEALGATARDSKLAQRLPEKMREAVERLTADGPVEKLYAPIEVFNEYWQSQQVDPGEVAAEILGNRESYDEAQRTGGDLAIPTGAYAEKLAGTDHHAFFAREVRTSPDAMSLREAEELSDRLRTMEAEQPEAAQIAVSEKAIVVRERITEQLLATGKYDETEVEAQARVHEQAFRSFAAQEGVDLDDLFERFTTRLAIQAAERISTPDQAALDAMEQPARYIRQQAVVGELEAAIEEQREALRTGHPTLAQLVDDFTRRFGEIEGEEIPVDEVAERPPLTEAVEIEDWGITIPAGTPQAEVDRIIMEGISWRAMQHLNRLLEFAKVGDRRGAKRYLASLDAEERIFIDEGVEMFAETRTWLLGRWIGREFEQAAVARKIEMLAGFHSKAERLIEMKMPTRADLTTITNILKDVKADEREWAGIDALLSEMGESFAGEVIEREYVLSALRARRLEITEIFKDGKSAMSEDERDDQLMDLSFEIMYQEIAREIRRGWRIYEKSGEWFAEQTSGAEWSQGAEPVGPVKNQREVRDLIEETLKENDNLMDWAQSRADLQLEAQGYVSTYAQYTLPGGENYQEITFQLPRLPGSFVSGHFGGRENVLAWLRTKDRILPDGRRMLFIEEIQSDWHQRGRERGYIGDRPFRLGTEHHWFWLKHGDIWWLYHRTPSDATNTRTHVIWGSGTSKEEVLGKLQESIEGREGRQLGATDPPSVPWSEIPEGERSWIGEGVREDFVPRAPFRNTWHEFVMKRAIRLASEEGYDAIGWTTGDQQADRWHLSNEVTSLQWTDTGGKDTQGNPVIRLDLDNFQTNQSETRHVGWEALTDQLGVERASKVRSEIEAGSENGRFRGRSIVGGHGMRIFYDQMLMSFADKFGKRYGAKVEEVEIPTEWVGKEFEPPMDRTVPVPEVLAGKEGVRAFLTQVHSVALTPELKRAALADEFALYQPAPEEGPPRAVIKFSEAGVSIDLLETADLTSFLHETGHFYLELLEELAPSSPSVARDRDVIRTWLGAEPGTRLTRDQHELFARGFERYLMEGRPPTPALRGAFARFRAWLIEIYRTVEALDVELTPEVRGVFSRMLVGDEALGDAAREAAPMTGALVAAGVPESEARDLADAQVGARAAAEEELMRRMLDDVRKERTRRWQKARAAIRVEVAEEVNADPPWRALAAIQRGELPDGSPGLFAGVKLDRASALELLGGDEAALRSLPTSTYVKSGGLHPDQIAELLGFDSGAALLRALPGRGEGSAARRIERLTDERTRAELGDLLTDGGFGAAAVEALHTEDRAKLLRKELEILARRDLPALKGLLRRVTRRAPPLDEVRAEARRIVAAKRGKDLRPDVHRRSEAKAARAALEALLRGDVELAFEEKQRELLSHELARASREALDEVEGIRDYAARFETSRVRARLKRAGVDYLAQIDALLSRFELRRVSGRAIEARRTLREFIEEHVGELGVTISIPEEVTIDAYAKNYRELTLTELRDVRDAVKQVDHLSTLKNRLLADARRRTVAEGREAIVGSIAAHHDIKTDAEIRAEALDVAPGFLERTKAKLRYIDAAHTKMEFLFEWLDGFVNLGPVWQHLFKPLADAEAAENAMMRVATRALTDIFSLYTRAERATWFYRKIAVDGFERSFTRSSLLVVALNRGNEYNWSALLEGYGWTEVQGQRLLDQLDERDWEVVQRIWDHLDSYWPSAAQLERQINGLPPARVIASPFRNRFGREMTGGYYPIILDKHLTWRQSMLESRNNVQELFGGKWARIMTRHGHLIERRGTGGAPIKLELTGLTNHVADVIHDLTHRRAVIDVRRLIEDPEVRRAIVGSVGLTMYDQIRPWLQHIASERRGDYLNPIEGFFGRMRMGATVVHLGWKMTTAIVQFTSYTNTVKELGVAYAARGLNDVFAQPWRMKERFDFVAARSEFMRDRLSNYDRDIRDSLKRLNVAGAKAGPLSVVDSYTREMRASWFILIGLMDMGASLPTWLGAYRRAMDGAVPELEKGNEASAIDYADKIVRQTQGVGAPKDLAAIQRGPEAARIFVMFYSYFSVLYQQFAKTQRAARMEGWRGAPKFIAAMTMLWFLPAALSELIVGDPPEEDADAAAWLRWLLKVEASYPFAAVILARDIVNGLDFGYQPSAVFKAGESLLRAARAVPKIFQEDEEIERADVKAGVMTAGYFASLPARQLWLSGEYFYDWATGEEEPDHPAEGLWRAIVKGKPRED